MKYIIINITILFGVLMPAFSQSKKEKKADKYYQVYYFDKAIDKYSHVDSLGVDGLRKLAESYHNRDEFVNAEATYAKIINDPRATITDYYNYVLLLKANGKYAEVRKWMDKIKAQKLTDLRVKNFEETEDAFSKLLVPNVNYKIADLEINSEEEDFGTAFFNNQIVFTSTRKSSKPIIFNYNWNRKPFLDILVADIDTAYQLKKPRYWNKKVNKKWHEGPACFARNDCFVAYTRNNYSDTIPDDIVRLQIFFSQFQNWEWTEPVPFYLNNPKYSVGHPALTKDGNTMFFISDMPGGYGGSDIYVVKRDSTNNEWGAPVNLGDKINTEANEMFPFYEEKSGLLFFSSNGLNGLGGLDVFVAQKTPMGFDSVRNVGSPINTRYDDFACIIDEKLKNGYFSSNRPEGKGDDDIYKFAFTGKFINKVPKNKYIPVKKQDSIKSFTYRLFVLNRRSRKPISKADVTLGELVLVTDSSGLVSKRFNKSISLKITVDAIGYKQEKTGVEVSSFRDGYVVTDTVLLVADVNKKIVLKNIYYDYDKWDILPESAVELDKLVKFMNENPELKVELSSHTDSRGSDAYNLRLSKARAKSAVNYIVSKGIDSSRISGVGYGETQLINRCANGIPCSEVEHRENRRTEIFIPQFGKAENVKQVKGAH